MGIKLRRGFSSHNKERSTNSRRSERSLRKRECHSSTAESDISQFHLSSPPQNLVVEENDDVSSIHCDESVSSPTFCFAEAPPRSEQSGNAVVPGPIKFVRSDSHVDGRPMLKSPAPSSRSTPTIDNTTQSLPVLTSLLYLSLVTFELHKNENPKNVVREALQRHAFSSLQSKSPRRTSVPVDVDDVSFVQVSDSDIQDLVLSHLERRNLPAAIDVVQARLHSKKTRRGTHVPLYFQLSVLYMLYGDVKKALWSSQRAICLQEGHSQQLVAALHNLGVVLLYSKKTTEALAQFRQAIHLECKLVGYDHACIPLLLNNLAICHVIQKNWNVSTVLLQESLQLLRDFPHADLESLRHMATTLMNLGIVSLKRKDYNQAVSYFEEGLMVMESIEGQDGPFLQQCRNTFQQLLVKRDFHLDCTPAPIRMPAFGYSDGISLRLGSHPVDVIVMGSLQHEQTLETRVQRAAMSSFHSSMLGVAQTKASIPIDVDGDTIVDAELHLAAIHARVWKHMRNDEMEEGLELLRLTLRSHRRKYGPVHPLAGYALHNIALVYLYAGRYQDADYYFQEAVSIRIAALGPNHPDVSISMLKLGMVQLAHGNLETAQVTFTQVLESRRKMIGYQQPEVARIMNLIGYIQYELSKPLEAISSMREALEIQCKCDGCDEDAAETLSSIGFLLAKNQEYAEAVIVLKEAVSLQCRVLSNAHAHTIVTRKNLNHVLSLQPGTVAYNPIHPCVESPIDLNCHPLSSFTPQWNDD